MTPNSEERKVEQWRRLPGRHYQRMMLMPGMPEQSNLDIIGIDDAGKILGLS